MTKQKWYTYTIKYYTTIKRNRVLVYVTWFNIGDNLGNYAKSKKLVSKDHVFYNSIYIKCSNSQTFRDGKLVVPRGWMSGDTGKWLLIGMGFSWRGGGWKYSAVTWLTIVAQVCEYNKKTLKFTLYLAKFILCKLYLNNATIFKKSTKTTLLHITFEIEELRQKEKCWT